MSNSITIIGIAGGSGSGKTTLAKKILHELSKEKCIILGQDSYYLDQSNKFDGDGGTVNFDHPSSIDFLLIEEHLKDLRKGNDIEVPIYDFCTHKRLHETTQLSPHRVVILDGTLILSRPEIRKHLDIKVFLDIPERVRYERRLKRDVEERGRTEEGVQRQFLAQVKPMHDAFVEPSKHYADYIVKDDFVVRGFLIREGLLKQEATFHSLI